MHIHRPQRTPYAGSHLLAFHVLSSAGLAQTAPAPAVPGPSAPAPAAPEEPVRLSEFGVTANQDIGYRSTNAADATRTNTPIDDIPMNVVVYNQNFIDDLMATSTDQLMAYEPSVVKLSENDTFLARGNTSVGTNYLDGFPQATGFTSQPLANIDRVEVIKGPDAVLYGSGDYGATIDRITKQPLPNPQYSLRTILSDYHSDRTEYDANSGSEPFIFGQQIMARVDGAEQRGYSWFGQRIREDNASPSLSWVSGDHNTRVMTEFFYDWIDNQSSWETPVHNGDPFGITTGNGVYHKYNRRMNWDSPADFRHVTRQVASTDITHTFSSHLKIRVQLQYADRGQHDIESFVENAAITILNDAVLVARTEREQDVITRNYNGRSEAEGQFTVGPVHEHVLAGMSVIDQYQSTHNEQAPSNYGGLTGTALTGNGRNTSGGSEFNYFPNLTLAQFEANPNLAGYNTNLVMPINLLDRGNEPPLIPSALIQMYPNAFSTAFTASQDYYANNQLGLFGDRFFLVAGGRYSEDTNKGLNFLTGTFPNEVFTTTPKVTAQWATATTYSYGAVLHLNASKTLTLYGNLNTSFTPTYTVNPDGSLLNPQQAKQKEVGLRFSFLHNRVNGLVDYFDLLQNGVVTANPVEAGYYIQINGARTKGAELSLNTDITDNWLAFGGLTYEHAFNDVTGVPQYLQPDMRGTLFTRYQFLNGFLRNFSLSAGAIYTGSRPMQIATVSRAEPAWALPSEWRFDLIAGYRFKTKGRTRWDAALKIQNVFDNESLYYVAVPYRYTIDPGRQWQLEFGCHF